MNIAERDENGVTVFVLQGRIDFYGAVDLNRVLQTALSESKRNFVLDVADVSYIGSSGVRALTDEVAKSREAGGDLKLVGLNRKVLRVLSIIGLDSLFSPYKTLEAAIADC